MKRSKGYSSLKAAVERDCNERNSCGCFNPNGCNVKGAKIGNYGEEGYKSCFHEYCDKFKWVIDRAKQYEETTGVSASRILTAWENHRNYWYMNYYQDCNQPEMKGDDVKVFATVQELKKSIGKDGFRCPACEGVSKNPYRCDSGKEKDGEPCNWSAGGLFGTLGKGVNVFIKKEARGETIFMPIAWEKELEAS